MSLFKNYVNFLILHLIIPVGKVNEILIRCVMPIRDATIQRISLKFWPFIKNMTIFIHCFITYSSQTLFFSLQALVKS